MMGTYEVWHGLMYGVGVFVTCNVGGAALRMAVSRVSGLMESSRAVTNGVEGGANRKPHPFDGCAFDEMNRYSEEEAVYAEAETVSTPRGGQSFEEMQRQIGEDTGGVSAKAD